VDDSFWTTSNLLEKGKLEKRKTLEGPGASGRKGKGLQEQPLESKLVVVTCSDSYPPKMLM
jgi:hypothetical protein